MSEIAFIGIALFRLTADYRTFADDLSAVQEASCLGVVELLGYQFFQITVLIQVGYEFSAFFGMYFLGIAKS